MAKLFALNPEDHGVLKHKTNYLSEYVKTSHMLPLLVTEVAKAIADFPVIISKTSQGDLALSALTSFQPGSNLYCINEEWASGFTSSTMNTYPVFLMKPQDGEKEPILGVDVGNPALSEVEGSTFFDEKGRPTLYQKQLKAQLVEHSENTVHTFQFLRVLQDLDLIRPVNVVLQYANSETNRITGLNMINEDNLHTLPSDKFMELRERGYLPPIYAMLLSVFQLNALIRLNNNSPELRQVKSINLEVTKDNRQA